MKRKIISGIVITMFLVTMVTFAIPVRVSAQFDGETEVGIVGPKGAIAWDGIIEGAKMARDMINHPEDFGLPGWGPENHGGLYYNATDEYYELKLVEIDEHGIPLPDPTAAVTELLTALDTHPTMQFLIGGFGTDVVYPMREAAMDYAAVHDRPIWIIAGASEDSLIDDGPEKDNPYDDVREDYERYKYMFRATPMNSTALGNQLFSMVAQLQIPKLSALFGSPLPTYIVGDDLTWNEAIIEAFEDYAALLGIDIVGVARSSIIETDFAPFLEAVEDSGAKLLIHLFGAVSGASFTKQWGEREIPAVPVGINVESQMQEFYKSLGGKCEYETIMAGMGTRTQLNPDAYPLNTVEFWDVYSERYGHSPIYTAGGGFGVTLGLNATFYAAYPGQPCSELITWFEAWDDPNGQTGYFKYTKYHDLYCDIYSATPIWPSPGAPPHVPGVPGVARSHIPQWQDGRLEVVWPRGYWCAPNPTNPISPDPTPLPFAGKWKIPPWVYSLGETDFAGGPEAPCPPFDVDTTVAGYFGSFTSPDGTVGPADMAVITDLWQQTCWWTVLEADMDGNQFIDIDDVARVALDWLKTA